MYLKSVEIENVGPIKNVKIEFPSVEGRPLPVVIVGENGSGKSILLSYIVNSLIVGKQEVFEDTEVEKGRVYKYRSPTYITSGADYSFSSVDYESGIGVKEWQLRMEKKEFESQLQYTPIRKEWETIPEGESSHFHATFGSNTSKTAELFKEQCCLYFPVNRFEEPAWLNLDNLKSKAEYTELKHISGFSNRNIVCTSPLRSNKNWILDLLFDRQTFEIATHQLPVTFAQNPQPTILNVFSGYRGQSSVIYESVLKVLRVVLREGGNIRIGAGTRKNRQIAVMKDEKSWIPNIFQLSTGETQLLNLFLSIVRDFDLSEGNLNALSDIKGIVVIDEIDAHLHVSHQREILPELIALFPSVQFVITTHSPLFLMGMEKTFGNAFRIFNMPNGAQVAPSDFSEFTAAYEAFKETTRHRDEIQKQLELHAMPIVFVEGDYDIRYLTKAAELLNQQDVLDRIQLKDGGGFGNLDKIWKGYNNPLSGTLPNTVLLVYDCDTKKQDESKNLVHKRVMPSILTNPIPIGIENLFPSETIQNLEAVNPRFIDRSAQSTDRIRGQEIIKPASLSVNKDEKGNMCNWLCEHGNADDFAGFAVVFQIIKDVING